MPQEMQTTAWLETERGDKIPLQGLCTIGRGESNHIILNTSAMSRHHAVIHERDKEFWMVDLGSINGLQVNGHRVVQPVKLRAGDLIRLPSAVFTFHQGTELITLPTHSEDRSPLVPETTATPDPVAAQSLVTQPLPKIVAEKVGHAPVEKEVTQALPVIAAMPKEMPTAPPVAAAPAVPVILPPEDKKQLPPAPTVSSATSEEKKETPTVTTKVTPAAVLPFEEKKTPSAEPAESGNKPIRGRKQRREAWKKKQAAQVETAPEKQGIKVTPVMVSAEEKKELLAAMVSQGQPLVESPEEKKNLLTSSRSGSLLTPSDEKGESTPARESRAPRVYVLPSDTKESASVISPTAPPVSRQLENPMGEAKPAPVIMPLRKESSATGPAASVVVSGKSDKKEEVTPIAMARPEPSTPPSLLASEAKSSPEAAKLEEKKGPSFVTVTKLSTVAVKPDEKSEEQATIEPKPAIEAKKSGPPPLPIATNKATAESVPAMEKAPLQKSESAKETESKPEPKIAKPGEQGELALDAMTISVKPEVAKVSGPAAAVSTEASVESPAKKEAPLAITAKEASKPHVGEEKKPVTVAEPVSSPTIVTETTKTASPLQEEKLIVETTKEEEKTKRQADVKVAQPFQDRTKPAKVYPLAKQSMYVGLVSIFLPFVGLLTAIAAVVMGHRALRIIKQSRGELAGRDPAMMGLYFGYITMGIILAYSTVVVLVYTTPSANDFAASSQEAIPLNLGTPGQKRQGLAPSMLTPGGQKPSPSVPPVAVASRPNPPAPLPTAAIPSSQDVASVLAPVEPAKSPDVPSTPSPTPQPPPAPAPSNDVATDTTVPAAPVNPPDKNEVPPAAPETEKTAVADNAPAVFSYDQQFKLRDEMLAMPMPNDSIDSASFMDAEAFNDSARILARKPEQKYADSVEEFLDGVKDRNPDQARLKILSRMFENYRAGLETQ